MTGICVRWSGLIAYGKITNEFNFFIMNNINVVYIGNEPPFLEVIREHAQLTSVVCSRINSYKAKQFFGSTYDYAKANSISIINPENIYESLLDQATDLIIVFGYGSRISNDILSIPKIASLNIHQSLLPRYRGRHPLNWSIINGEAFTGVTIHHMNEHFDDGNIVLQEKLDILQTDNIMSLYKKTINAGIKLLAQTLNILGTKIFEGRKQNKELASYFPPRTPKDGRILWNNSSLSIYNMVRALTYPYPGAYFYYNKNKIIIEEIEIVDYTIEQQNEVRIGQPFFYRNQWYFRTATGFIKIKKIRNRRNFKLLQNIKRM